jgi:hypothetical protein
MQSKLVCRFQAHVSFPIVKSKAGDVIAAARIWMILAANREGPAGQLLQDIGGRENDFNSLPCRTKAHKPNARRLASLLRYFMALHGFARTNCYSFPIGLMEGAQRTARMGVVRLLSSKKLPGLK